MNVVNTMSRNTARRAIGSVWYLDELSDHLVEHLGKGRPRFHFGETYASIEEARAAHPDREEQPLPEAIKLLRKTPIVSPVGRDMETATTYLWLVSSENVVTNGLRVEKRAVTAVDYMAAPEWMGGKVDWVACKVFLEGETSYCCYISHDRDLYPIIDGGLQKRAADDTLGWSDAPDARLFIKREDAEAHADEIADRLIAIARWRDVSAAA